MISVKVLIHGLFSKKKTKKDHTLL